MKAIQVTRFGGPDVLAPAEVDEPIPGPGEVVISVQLAGVPFGDTIVRSGIFPVPLPYIPGLEVAGVVTRLGDGVDAALLGVNAVATTRGNCGGYAERVAANVNDVYVLPEGLAPQTALAVFQAGAVAIALAEVMNVGPGETALVLAAAGRIGTLLVQELLRRGMTVIAAVGSPEKRSVPLVLGAHHAVVYDTPDWTDAVRSICPVDVVFDGVGGQVGAHSLDTLADGAGRLGLLGYASGAWTAPNPQVVARRGLTVTGTIGKAMALPFEQRRNNTRVALHQAASGGLRTVAPTRYRLEDAVQAHAALESRATTGAAVLSVDGVA